MPRALRARHGCACAAGNRASSRDGDCSAGTCACSQETPDTGESPRAAAIARLPPRDKTSVRLALRGQLVASAAAKIQALRQGRGRRSRSRVPARSPPRPPNPSAIAEPTRRATGPRSPPVPVEPVPVEPVPVEPVPVERCQSSRCQSSGASRAGASRAGASRAEQNKMRARLGRADGRLGRGRIAASKGNAATVSCPPLLRNGRSSDLLRFWSAQKSCPVLNPAPKWLKLMKSGRWPGGGDGWRRQRGTLGSTGTDVTADTVPLRYWDPPAGAPPGPALVRRRDPPRCAARTPLRRRTRPGYAAAAPAAPPLRRAPLPVRPVPPPTATGRPGRGGPAHRPGNGRRMCPPEAAAAEPRSWDLCHDTGRFPNAVAAPRLGCGKLRRLLWTGRARRCHNLRHRAGTQRCTCCGKTC